MRLEISRVVRQATLLIREYALLFFVLAIITALPSALLRYEETLRPPDEVLSASYLVLVSVFIVSLYLLTAAVAKAALLAQIGQRPSLKSSLEEIARDFFAVAVMALIASFISVSAFILAPLYPLAFALLIPGFFIDVILSVLIPVRTIERTGIIASFMRSIELTKGHRWPVLGLLVALTMLSMGYEVLIYLVVGDPALIEFEISSRIAFVCLVAADAAFGIVGAVVSTVLYFELRLIKEGAGLETLASEFD
jgi:hypothetical protein